MANQDELRYPPPPCSYGIGRVLWTTCAHFRQDRDGNQSCNAPGQAFLFPATSCAKCKRFSRREP
jgi:hypothetical protein